MLDGMRWWWAVMYGVGVAGTATVTTGSAHAEPLVIGPAIEIDPPAAGVGLSDEQGAPAIASDGTNVLTAWTFDGDENPFLRNVVAMPLDAQCTPLLDRVVDTGGMAQGDTRIALEWDGNAFAMLLHDYAGDRPAELRRLDAMGQLLGDQTVALPSPSYEGLSCASGRCIAVSWAEQALTVERIDADGAVQQVASLPEAVARDAVELVWTGDAHVVLWPRTRADGALDFVALRFDSEAAPQDDVPVVVLSGIAYVEDTPLAVAGGPTWLLHYGEQLWNIDGSEVVGTAVDVLPFHAGAWFGAHYVLVDPQLGAQLYLPGATAIDELVPFTYANAHGYGGIVTTDLAACIRGEEAVVELAADGQLGASRNPMLGHASQYGPLVTHAEDAGLVSWSIPDPRNGYGRVSLASVVDGTGTPLAAPTPLGFSFEEEELASSRVNHARVHTDEQVSAIELVDPSGAVMRTLDVPARPVLAGRAHRYLATWATPQGIDTRVFDPAGDTIGEHSLFVSPTTPIGAIAAGDGFVVATMRVPEATFPPDEEDMACSLVFLDADGSLAAESDDFDACPWNRLAALTSDGERVLLLFGGSTMRAWRFDMNGAWLDDEPLVLMEEVGASALDAVWDGEAVLLAWQHGGVDEIDAVSVMRFDIDGAPLDAEPITFESARVPDLAADGRLLVYQSTLADPWAPRVVMHVVGSDPPGEGDESSSGDSGDGATEGGGADGQTTEGGDGDADSASTAGGCGCRTDDRAVPGWLLVLLAIRRPRRIC